MARRQRRGHGTNAFEGDCIVDSVSVLAGGMDFMILSAIVLVLFTIIVAVILNFAFAGLSEIERRMKG